METNMPMLRQTLITSFTDHVHQGGQVIGRNKLGYFQRLSIQLVLSALGFAVFRNTCTLITAILSAVILVATTAAAELSQRSLDLLLNLLVVLLRVISSGSRPGGILILSWLTWTRTGTTGTRATLSLATSWARLAWRIRTVPW